MSHAVQAVVEAEGLSVVRSLVGHGIGRDMHEDPQIPNYGPAGKGIKLEEGMVFAIEPMVTTGRHAVRMGEDHWSIYSQDGSLAAHFEFTIAITADGPEGPDARGTKRPAEKPPEPFRLCYPHWSRSRRDSCCPARVSSRLPEGAHEGTSVGQADV